MKRSKRFVMYCAPGRTRCTLSAGRAESSDEDCLTLNVWAPERAEALPVMVWFHGGGFELGSGHADGGYAGDHLVAHDRHKRIQQGY